MMPWVSQPPATIDWSQFIPRVSLFGLTPAVDLRYFDSPWGPLVGVSRWVIDTSKKSPRWISAAYPLPAVVTADDAMCCLYRLVSENMAHEVLEHMTIDGRVWRNPHGRDGSIR